MARKRPPAFLQAAFSLTYDHILPEVGVNRRLGALAVPVRISYLLTVNEDIVLAHVI